MRSTRRIVLAAATAALLLTGCTAMEGLPEAPGTVSAMEATGRSAAIATPTDLTVDRTPTLMKVTWRGVTTDYDLAQCRRDRDTGEWGRVTGEALRPAAQQGGKFYKGVTALPQGMAFCVRAVRGDERSEWTPWEISEKP